MIFYALETNLELENLNQISSPKCFLYIETFRVSILVLFEDWVKSKTPSEIFTSLQMNLLQVQVVHQKFMRNRMILHQVKVGNS